MLYLLETKLPENKSVSIALTRIYGIGEKTALIICKKLGFSTLVISNLTNYGAGITKDVLNHEDVILNAMKNKEKINKLLATIIERI